MTEVKPGRSAGRETVNTGPVVYTQLFAPSETLQCSRCWSSSLWLRMRPSRWHSIGVNKTASALIAAGSLWTVYAMMSGNHDQVGADLTESLAATAQVVFFLMGAMTIVEVVDAHNGFEVITSRIRTNSQPALMWLIGFVTFFLSAVLDNLTTTIVMISLTKKLIDNHEDRLFFAGMIVVAANAGGAWSPIGDVTTTMLWIGGQITTLAIMEGVFLAALVNLLVPLLVTSYLLRARVVVCRRPRSSHGRVTAPPTSRKT